MAQFLLIMMIPAALGTGLMLMLGSVLEGAAGKPKRRRRRRRRSRRRRAGR